MPLSCWLSGIDPDLHPGVEGWNPTRPSKSLSDTLPLAQLAHPHLPPKAVWHNLGRAFRAVGEVEFALMEARIRCLLREFRAEMAHLLGGPWLPR